MDGQRDPQHPIPGEMPLSTLRILWASMLFSQILFAVVATQLPPAETPDTTMAAMLLFAALPCGAMSLLWGRVIGQQGPAQTRYILRWAFAEACAVMGLASWMVAGVLPLVAASMFLGFVLVLMQPPRIDG